MPLETKTTKIKGIIKRQIRLYRVPAPVITRITETGIEMSVAGSRMRVEASWERIAAAMCTPMNVPSFLEGRPIEFLRHQAEKLGKKKDIEQ